MTKIVSFSSLQAWQKSHKLVIEIYKATEKFPAKDAFGLVSQLERSAVSITSNIAEGFGRQGVNDKLNFYVMARGSIVELQNQLLIARDTGRISQRKFTELAELSVDALKLVHGLIRSTKKRGS